MLGIANQMVVNGISMQQAIDLEVDHVMEGLPLLRDKPMDASEYREIHIKKMEQQIRRDKQWLEVIKKEADEKGIPLDENIHRHAAYMVDQKILNGEIILPQY